MAPDMSKFKIFNLILLIFFKEENGNLIKLTEMGSFFMWMEIFLKDSGQMTKQMDMGNIYT